MAYSKPLQRRHHKSTKHRIKNPDALDKQARILERKLVKKAGNRNGNE